MDGIKRLPENTAIYKIFPCNKNKSSNCDPPSLDSLEIIAENCIHKLSGFLNRYIWQNESFNLRVVSGSADSPSHLEGKTCFEDNIDDEWFLVFLLHYLSKHNDNLTIQILDNDGDFLLIEAAEHIPKWLDPDTSENRVFIYNGELHIIPIAQNPGEITPIPSGTPSIFSAIAAIRDFSSVTKASEAVQKSIGRRLNEFPHKIDLNKHRAHCYLPCAVAAILKEDPKLLPHAVKAFYLRDPIDLKACRAMRYFAPETRVMTEVIFTRCLYAQLMCQKYEPDKRTGWDLPSVNSPQRKAHELGMKLACGFEILTANAQNMIIEGDPSNHDFNNDVRWRRFATSLKDKGYFCGEIDGSKLYQHLMLQAKDFYLSSLKKDTNGNINPGLRIKSLLETLSVNFEEMKEEEKSLRPEDDDSWMTMTPEKLDKILEQMSQQHCSNSCNIAKTITGELKSFVNHRSDFEGAEIPEFNKKSKKQKINFDPDAFADAVNNILDFRIPGSDDEGSSSSMSGYSDDDDDEVALGEEKCDKSKNIARNSKNALMDMQSYMTQMDRELAQTDVGQSFERLPPKAVEDGSESDINDEEDDFRPVDVDLTSLKNILESYSSQQGLPGPVSNLFSSMGIEVPDNSES